MINKTQIMQWFVQWLDTQDWKMDFASDANWRRVQAIAYNQPGLADQIQYDKTKVQGATKKQKTNRARNPQAVEGMGGDWKKRSDALGLAVPQSLRDRTSNTRKIVDWWQTEAVAGRNDQTGETLLASGLLARNELIAALTKLMADGVVVRGDIGAAEAGKKFMSRKYAMSPKMS